jgi:hypothetical protein
MVEYRLSVGKTSCKMSASSSQNVDIGDGLWNELVQDCVHWRSVMLGVFSIGTLLQK